jgi:hypothetical protein
MTPEQAKKKTALIIIGSFFGSFAVLALIILLRDFIYAAIFISSVTACIVLTGWGIWAEYWPQLYARQKMIDDLYSLAHTPEQKKWTKFFIEYFKL